MLEAGEPWIPDRLRIFWAAENTNWILEEALCYFSAVVVTFPGRQEKYKRRVFSLWNFDPMPWQRCQ